VLGFFKRAAFSPCTSSLPRSVQAGSPKCFFPFGQELLLRPVSQEAASFAGGVPFHFTFLADRKLAFGRSSSTQLGPLRRQCINCFGPSFLSCFYRRWCSPPSWLSPGSGCHPPGVGSGCFFALQSPIFSHEIFTPTRNPPLSHPPLLSPGAARSPHYPLFPTFSVLHVIRTALLHHSHLFLCSFLDHFFLAHDSWAQSLWIPIVQTAFFWVAFSRLSFVTLFPNCDRDLFPPPLPTRLQEKESFLPWIYKFMLSFTHGLNMLFGSFLFDPPRLTFFPPSQAGVPHRSLVNFRVFALVFTGLDVPPFSRTPPGFVFGLSSSLCP